ncbi:hypothetical protein TNCV_2459681 [Trichonephila clavipes]|nr:hypothetical protein TNCV_2459681 [Trichonephila clavipes]
MSISMVLESGQTIAYQVWYFPGDIVIRNDSNSAAIMLMGTRWVQEFYAKCHTGSQRLPVIKTREERHVDRLV